jgi:hypothetical protein
MAKISFKAHLEAIEGLKDSHEEGLQALKKSDRELIKPPKTKKLCGSVDLDKALEKRYPNASRWDYGIAIECQEKIYTIHWIEVHPAGSGKNYEEILNKALWLRDWLKNHGQILNSEKLFIWIASGKARVPTAPQNRSLLKQGVRLVGKQYIIE